MESRYTIVAALFLLISLLGALIFSDETALEAAASLQAIATDHFPSQIWLQVANFLAFLSNKGAHLSQSLTSQKDLLFYGGAALLGTLMTALVIRSGRKISNREDEIRSLLRDLRQEKDQAENLARLKSEFLNQVSHELRTPLAVILGYLECIIDGLYGRIDDKNKEILRIVSRQSTDLQHMIERILVFSRLEAGKSHVRIEEFSLDKIQSELKDGYDFLGRQKGLEIIWDLPKEVITLRSDFERFRELLSNLIQNALKYTDHGSICVQIRYLSNIDSIALEVADTGMGIAQDSLATIFDPFVQVHKTSSENSRGGIGLGLSIVKKHIEQLKGSINIESEVGKGTTFKIILPRVYKEDRASPKKLFKLLNFPRNHAKASNE